MTDAPTKQLPEYPGYPAKGSRGRTWLIVIASVLGAAVIALVIVLVVRSSGAPAPTPTPTPSASASVTPTPTPTPTQTTAPAVTSCAAASLTITLGSPDGAAGSTTLPIIFANSGTQPCTLTGYPIVSFVDGSGAAIGAAATPDTTQAQNANTLQPGSSATALLKITSAGNVDNCNPQDASDIKVQAPDVATPVTLAAAGYTACANGTVNILSVGPVAAG